MQEDISYIEMASEDISYIEMALEDIVGWEHKVPILFWDGLGPNQEVIHRYTSVHWKVSHKHWKVSNKHPKLYSVLFYVKEDEVPYSVQHQIDFPATLGEDAEVLGFVGKMMLKWKQSWQKGVSLSKVHFKPNDDFERVGLLRKIIKQETGLFSGDGIWDSPDLRSAGDCVHEGTASWNITVYNKLIQLRIWQSYNIAYNLLIPHTLVRDQEYLDLTIALLKRIKSYHDSPYSFRDE